jgi:hypothetical protein
MNTVALADLERFGSLSDSQPIMPKDYGKIDRVEDVSDRFGDWSGLLAGCAFAQSCSAATNAATLPEPQWYALASLLGRCKNGLSIFHEISAQDAGRYDQAATEAKFAQAQTASAPRTCRSIRDDTGFEGCQHCVFWRHA